MSKIDETFRKASENNKKILITYLMAGSPSISSTISAVRGLVRGGADIIELGYPFSDPLADGPVIQNASMTSIKNKMTLEKFYQMVKKIKNFTDTPLVLMTYSNILYKQGFENVIKKSSQAGIDGFIIPDLPIEESQTYLDIAKKYNCDTIFLVSPNTSKKRVLKIIQKSSGFLYLVAVYGTTGSRKSIPNYAIKTVRRVKNIQNKLPLGVGFGVKTPQDVAKYIKSGADAVIVGSALVELIQKTQNNAIQQTVFKFARRFKKQTYQ